MDKAFTDFLIQAKVSGYAAEGDERKLKFDDGSIGFEYSNDIYKYIDRYYGSNPFSGTEHICNDKNDLVWKMNYFGMTSPAYPNLHEIYGFLKEAMQLITPEHPFRGPKKLTNGKLTYKNDQHVSLFGFNGVETIFCDDEKVYELHYHGGNMMAVF